MTGRRRFTIAAVLLFIVAALAITLTLTTNRNSANKNVDPRTALLQQSDFPAGYVVSEIENSEDSAPPGTVTPPSCQSVLDDQFKRNMKRVTLDTIVDNDSHPESPRYAQTVARDGESVNEAIAVVQNCPRHSSRNSSGITAVDSAVMSPPSGCPSRARYVRLTGSVLPSNGGTKTSTSYVMAYLQSDQLVSIVTQVVTGTPSADTTRFCVVVAHASARLNGAS